MQRVEVDVRWLRDPGHLLSLGLGSGLAPKAPGTVGSLAAALIAVPLLGFGTLAFGLVTAALCAAAIPLAGRTARALGVHDHPAIVIDEFAGMWLALVGTATAAYPPWALGVAFVWFRVFDILKPWPISVLDRRLGNGFGIVADDLAAGVAANAATFGILWLAGETVH